MKITTVSGGSINKTYRISIESQEVFCKLNSATKFPQLFTAEKNGLACIRKQNIIRVPPVIDCFATEDTQILLMDWIQEGERNRVFWERFGEQLAALHKQSNPQFGFTENNYMGSVPQCNQQHATWSSFFVAERLQPLLRRCAEKKLLTSGHLRSLEKLAEQVKSIFEEENPSLLHGDLWSGNFMCNKNSEPVLIDPAVYYGHRSVDLAMTTLFGGFQKPFYEAYNDHFPLPANYREQWAICNLYPLLIHLYLFGKGYLSQIESTVNHFQ